MSISPAADAPVLKPIHAPAGRTDGRLQLRLGVRRGKTEILESSWRYPLQMMKPQELAGGGLMAFLLHPAGGILDGDALRVQVVLEEGARALLTTPSASRAYRMENGGALQELDVCVGRGATLEFLPEATMLYAGSRLTQRTSVTMEEDAHLIWWEIVATGRRAHGELLAFTSYRSSFEVRQGGLPLAVERVHLEPAQKKYRWPTLLAHYSHWGSLWIFTTGKHLEISEELARSEIRQNPNVHAGISRLHRGGLLLRVLGNSSQEIQGLFCNVWKQVCPEILGSPAPDLRKY